MLVKLWESRHAELIDIIWGNIAPAGGEQINDVLPAVQAGRLAGDEIASYILELRKYKMEALYNERKMEDILLQLYDNHPGSLLIFQRGVRTTLFGSYDVNAFASILAARDQIIRLVSHVPGDLKVIEEQFERNRMYRARTGLSDAA